MIQFNLLPDVKIEYMRTRRLKRILFLAAIFATALSTILIILTFSMTAFQKNHISNLDKDIERLEGELNDTEDLTKILTVQNQLNTLPSLYDGRPAVDRLPGYLDQVTPGDEGTGISRLELDFSVSTFKIEGVANSLETVNKFVDALKFTSYSLVDPDTEDITTARAFSGVVLSDFSREDSKDSDKDKKAASFTIEMTFDPIIFDETSDVSLKVPSQVTTRSAIKSTKDLFNVEPSEEEEGL